MRRWRSSSASCGTRGSASTPAPTPHPRRHLPLSFPASADQLAHPALAGAGLPNETPAKITYDEGAAIGYKWYEAKGFTPLFAFGHGLSYTRFALADFAARPDGKSVKLSFS